MPTRSEILAGVPESLQKKLIGESICSLGEVITWESVPGGGDKGTLYKCQFSDRDNLPSCKGCAFGLNGVIVIQSG